jgi:hypothetical protein
LVTADKGDDDDDDFIAKVRAQADKRKAAARKAATPESEGRHVAFSCTNRLCIYFQSKIEKN